MNPFLLTVCELVLKSTGLLLLGFGVQSLWRKASAAQRSMTWLAVFLGIVLLPLAQVIPPTWTLGWQKATPVRENVSNIQISEESVTIPTATVAAAESEHTWNWTAWSLGIWSVGLVVVLGRRVFAGRKLRALEMASPLVTDSRLLQQMQEISLELGVRRTVIMRKSADALVPFTWGWLRPVLLMPASASTWNDTTLGAALRHELGHVRHYDFLTRMIMVLGCALHWPNPLAWIAAKAWRTAQEQACDDLVVAAGVAPQAYAQQLLLAAQAVQTGGVWRSAALGMAQPSTLETRLTCVLDSQKNRQPWRKSGLLAGLGATMLIVLLSGLIQWRVQAQEKPQDAVSALASKLILPSLKFQNATLDEAVAYLRAKSIELDPGKKGLNFVVRNPPKKTAITIEMKNISMDAAVQLIAQLANLEVTTNPEAMSYILQPKGKPKAFALVLKRLAFDQTPITDVVKYLHNQSIELDPDKRGIEIVVLGKVAKIPPITLDLRDVPLGVALEQIADLSGLEIKISDKGVILTAPGKKP